LYVAAWLKFSANWEGHPSGINKMLYFLLDDGSPKVYLAGWGFGSDALRPMIALQGLAASYKPADTLSAGTTLNVFPNLNIGKRIMRGAWHKYELVLTTNTPGIADGRIESWVDGVPQHFFDGIQFTAPGEGTRWAGMQWAPVWGGIGGIVPAAMYQRLDHLYLSGR
jgi:hypothetical protein